MKAPSQVDKFGQFIVENLRDKGIGFAEGLLQKHWKAPDYIEMQNELGELSASQKEAFKKAIIATVDGAIHDFLFALQERKDIQILVDGQDLVELSDGIHGEAYSEDGWYAKFSKFQSS
jgi:hypothetical protein